MTKETKNTIINFAKNKLKRDDLEFKIQESEHHKKPFLILVIDCAKMDVNSGKFDKSYYDLLTREDEERPSGLYLRFDDKVLDNVTVYFKKYMNLDLGSWFHYKNYKYIDSIEKKIEKAISKSSNPQVQIEFKGSGDRPKLTLCFYNINSELMNSSDKFNEYILELESIMGDKYDLDSYSISKTMGSKH